MPEELHTELKAALAYDRSSFADLFNKAAREYLAEHVIKNIGVTRNKGGNDNG